MEKVWPAWVRRNAGRPRSTSYPERDRKIKKHNKVYVNPPEQKDLKAIEKIDYADWLDETEEDKCHRDLWYQEDYEGWKKWAEAYSRNELLDEIEDRIELAKLRGIV